MTQTRPQPVASARLVSVALALALMGAAEPRSYLVEAEPIWLATNSSAPTVAKASASIKLQELFARRIGPDMRASSSYQDFADIQLVDSLEGWRLAHERASEIALHQVNLYWPQVSALLSDANVSEPCALAAHRTFRAAERLDAWAIQMWSATGNLPPVGLLDGHFTDLGSYRGCVDIKQRLEHADVHVASYCLLGFRPVVPSRRRFHAIFEREDARLEQEFPASDVFHQAARWAQYFHYLYLLTGVCVPAECSPRDLQRVSSVIGSRLALMSAPVKCFTRAQTPTADIRSPPPSRHQNSTALAEPLLIDLNAHLSSAQVVALAVLGAYFGLILLATVWHALELISQWILAGPQLEPSSLSNSHHRDEPEFSDSPPGRSRCHHQTPTATLIKGEGASRMQILAFDKLSVITNAREFCYTSMRPNEIKCLHGLRALTMVWIICVHTLQYNDWSGFSRVFENETTLKNPLVQPLVNANYVVDNFFLMSGLLAAYTTWHHQHHKSNQYQYNSGAASFSPLAALLGRYLRLTPQVLLASLLNILLPLAGEGPFWHDMTHEASANCEQNWWLNLLHIQSFYRQDAMCNLVGWWISVDMLYYVLALAILWLLARNRPRLALASTALVVGYCTLVAARIHYTGQFTPNNLATVPQVAEVWSDFVVHFVWTPYPHATPFFLGLWLGWLLAGRKWYRQVRAHSRLGWSLAVSGLLAVNLSSRLWITGYLKLDRSPQGQFISTSYNQICVLIWSLSFGWTIVACHYGCAPRLNKLLSTRLCARLSRASFIIYLSHMLVVRAFFGNQYNLLEVSFGIMGLIMMSIVVMSIIFGIGLCITFEGPCLKLHRSLLEKMRKGHNVSSPKLALAGVGYEPKLFNHHMDQKQFANTSGDQLSRCMPSCVTSNK